MPRTSAARPAQAGKPEAQPTWAELSPAQQQALAPLTGTWAAPGVAPSVGASVTGALRAEQVRLGSSEAELSGCETTRHGVVRDAIFEGERLVYEIDLAPGTLLRVFDHDPAAHKQFAIGDNVAMGWNARDVLTFPN